MANLLAEVLPKSIPQTRSLCGWPILKFSQFGHFYAYYSCNKTLVCLQHYTQIQENSSQVIVKQSSFRFSSIFLSYRAKFSIVYSNGIDMLIFCPHLA